MIRTIYGRLEQLDYFQLERYVSNFLLFTCESEDFKLGRIESHEYGTCLIVARFFNHDSQFGRFLRYKNGLYVLQLAEVQSPHCLWMSSVTNMYQMFHSADAFNQPIGSWDAGSQICSTCFITRTFSISPLVHGMCLLVTNMYSYV